MSITTVAIVIVVVLGIIALGKILEGVVEALVGAAGILLVAYGTGVIAVVVLNLALGYALFADVLLSWIAVLQRVFALIA